MGAEAFCNFAEYLQNTAEVLEVKPKETLTGLLLDLILWVIPLIPAGCVQIHNNLSAQTIFFSREAILGMKKNKTKQTKNTSIQTKIHSKQKTNPS